LIVVDSLRMKEADDPVVPEEIKEGGPPVPSEDKADVKPEAEEPIALSGESEEKEPEGAVRDAVDFDMQQFLDAEPGGVTSSGKSDIIVEEDVASEAITEGELDVSSEGKADVGLKAKDQIAPSGKVEEKSHETAG